MPTPARRIAFQVLKQVEQGGSSLADLLAGPEPQRLDPRDRGFLHELVLGTLRHRGAVDHALSRHVDRPLADLDADVRTVLRLGGLPDPAPAGPGPRGRFGVGRPRPRAGAAGGRPGERRPARPGARGPSARCRRARGPAGMAHDGRIASSMAGRALGRPPRTRGGGRAGAGPPSRPDGRLPLQPARRRRPGARRGGRPRPAGPPGPRRVEGHRRQRRRAGRGGGDLSAGRGVADGRAPGFRRGRRPGRVRSPGREGAAPGRRHGRRLGGGGRRVQAPRPHPGPADPALGIRERARAVRRRPPPALPPTLRVGPPGRTLQRPRHPLAPPRHPVARQRRRPRPSRREAASR